MPAPLLRYGDGFYVLAADAPIPPEKIQQYIIEYYNKEAKPLGEKAKRYLKDYLTELQTALEYYRKVGLVIGERPFEVALGLGDHKLYNERIEDATDNYYQQMSRLTSKTNQRFDTDYKNLTRTQKQKQTEQKAAQQNPFEDLRQERLLAEKTLQQLNETDNEVRTVTESLHQSITTALVDQMKQVAHLMERTQSEPFLMMLTKYDKGRASWMAIADKFRFDILGRLFEETEELQEEAKKRFEKAKLRAEIGRDLPQEQFGKEAMTAPKQLNYNGRVYHLVEAAEDKPKFEGFPEIIKQKPLDPEDLKAKATALRNLGMRLRQVGQGETSGEAVQAIRTVKAHLETLMKAYEMLSEFESFFPAKVKLMGNEQRALGLYEEALAKLGALDESTELWGKQMGRWAHMVNEMAAKRRSEDVRRPDPTDDPSKMKAPPQTVRF